MERGKHSRFSLPGLLLLALSCDEASTAPASSFEPAVGARQVTIDFTSFGEGIFEPEFYRKDGIRFPARRYVL